MVGYVGVLGYPRIMLNCRVVKPRTFFLRRGERDTDIWSFTAFDLAIVTYCFWLKDLQATAGWKVTLQEIREKNNRKSLPELGGLNREGKFTGLRSLLGVQSTP